MDKKIPNGFPFELKEDEEIKQIVKFPDYWISIMEECSVIKMHIRQEKDGGN